MKRCRWVLNLVLSVHNLLAERAYIMLVFSFPLYPHKLGILLATEIIHHYTLNSSLPRSMPLMALKYGSKQMQINK